MKETGDLIGEKQTQEKRIGTGKPGPGRKKGVPNKLTRELRRIVFDALELAGYDIVEQQRKNADACGVVYSGPDDGSAVEYLRKLAHSHPRAFCALLGRLLPTQVTGDEDGGPVRFENIVREIVCCECKTIDRAGFRQNGL